jgi:hypothetical protein
MAGAVGAALLAAPAGATLRVQSEALERGFPSGNCGYCHTFDSDHMKNEAKKQNRVVRGLDCYACHGRRLPKKGAWLLNERGLHLVNAKRHLGAERVNAEWLSSYKEPRPARRK